MLSNPSAKATWLAIALIFGLVIGISAGVLAHLSGSDTSKSVLIGGAALGGATLFLIGLVQFAGS